MSDTPETDAVLQVDCVGDDYSPLLEHARSLERRLQEQRRAALEEAAKVCEDDALKYERVSASRIAKLIRALAEKGKP